MASLRDNYKQEIALAAFSRSTGTPFTIPDYLSSQTQTFDHVEWVSVNQPVYFTDEVNYATLKVIAIKGNTLTLFNAWNDRSGTTIGVRGKLSPAGIPGVPSGMMQVATYDADGDGVVDNAERLGGLLPASFATNSQGALADTALQPSDIGDTVQPYDVDYPTVKFNANSALQPNDNITELTNNAGYLTVVENIPDGTLINNVANFYRSTKPLTRIDGSPLVAGDRWWNTSDRTDWFWNGTYWLSTQSYGPRGSNTFTTPSASFSVLQDGIGIAGDVFIEKLILKYKSQTAHNADNYRMLTLSVYGTNYQDDELALVYYIPLNGTTFGGVIWAYPSSTYFKGEVPVNRYVPGRGDIHISYNNLSVVVGSPGTMWASFWLVVRKVF